MSMSVVHFMPNNPFKVADFETTKSAVAILLLLQFDGSAKNFEISNRESVVCVSQDTETYIFERPRSKVLCVSTFKVISKTISSLRTFIRKGRKARQMDDNYYFLTKKIQAKGPWTVHKIRSTEKLKKLLRGNAFERLSKLTPCFKILTAAELRSLSHDSFFKINIGSVSFGFLNRYEKFSYFRDIGFRHIYFGILKLKTYGPKKSSKIRNIVIIRHRNVDSPRGKTSSRT